MASFNTEAQILPLSPAFCSLAAHHWNSVLSSLRRTLPRPRGCCGRGSRERHPAAHAGDAQDFVTANPAKQASLLGQQFARLGLTMPATREEFRAVVDAQDLSLNVSREILQQDRQIAAIHRHALTVRFHLQLLKVSGQPAEPLVIGQHGAGGVSGDLVVPDADKGQQHRQAQAQVQPQRQHIVLAPARQVVVLDLVRRRLEAHARRFGVQAVPCAQPVPAQTHGVEAELVAAAEHRAAGPEPDQERWPVAKADQDRAGQQDEQRQRSPGTAAMRCQMVVETARKVAASQAGVQARRTPVAVSTSPPSR